ncbi:hypothetical protein [Bacterioplanoides sp.]|uniref:hypothetical protein n=1 Tax=Bacterioplanoides sp. TaxID=2066072 RepID=UPI003B00E89E
MKRILGLIPILTLVGCASTYVVPKSESYSNLTLPAEESNWQFLGGSSRQSVSFGFAGENGCGTFFKEIPAKNEGDKEVTIQIPSGREIFVGFFASSGNSLCRVNVIFTALEGADYRVEKLGSGYGCAISIFEMTKSGDNKPVALGEVKQNSLTGEVCKL